MTRPTPVVNRVLSEAEQEKLRRKKQRTQPPLSQAKRLRKIIGGSGIQLLFEEPVKPARKPKSHGKAPRTAKDPLTEETRKAVLRKLRKRRAGQLTEILFKNLDRFERRDRFRLPVIPPLHWVAGWLDDKTEVELLDLLLAELCGTCRLKNVLMIHGKLSYLRKLRERNELLDQFFKKTALTKTLFQQYAINPGKTGRTRRPRTAEERQRSSEAAKAMWARRRQQREAP